MPKVYLSKQDKLNNRLTAWIYGQMKVKETTQSKLADEIGMSQQRFNYKLRKQVFSFRDFLMLVDALNPDMDELKWLLGKEGN